MRKVLIAAAVATSALAAAAPAAAQYYQPGYAQPYGYGQQQQYGYNQGGQNYLYRVDRLTQRIDQLGQRGILSRGEYRGLRNEAFNLRNRIARSGYNGLSFGERRDIDVRLANLERRIFNEARDRDGRRDGRWGNGNQGQYGNGYPNDPRFDRDRDGRDDRYEDDRGRFPG